MIDKVNHNGSRLHNHIDVTYSILILDDIRGCELSCNDDPPRTSLCTFFDNSIQSTVILDQNLASLFLAFQS